MKLLVIILGTCLVASVSFAQEEILKDILPTFKPMPDHNIKRRQLTPVQQTHILSDIQQHQHRFALHQQQQQPVSQVRFPTERFSQQQPQLGQFGQPSQQSFRSAFPPQQGNERQGFALQQPIQNNIQHHTQTSFQPNFLQQQQQNRPFPVPQQRFPSNPQTQSFHGSNDIAFSNAQFNNAQPQSPIPTSDNSAVQSPFFNQPQSTPDFTPARANLNNRFLGEQQFQQQQQPAIQPSIQTQPIFQQQQNFQQNVIPQQQQQQVIPQQPIFDPKEEENRRKENEERQKLIEKHEIFVRKQYEKQQQKVREEHEKFLESQREINIKTRERLEPIRQQYSQNQNNYQQFPKSRRLLPSEAPIFEVALKQYFELHPTTTTTTTTTTTPAPTTIETTQRSTTARQQKKAKINPEELELLQGQTQKLFEQLKEDTEKKLAQTVKSKNKVKSTKALGRDELIRQLKSVLAEQPIPADKNYTSMDLVLPNGEKVQVIRTTDPNLIQGATPLTEESLATATSNQSPVSFEDLQQRGILPEGSDFEVVRQTEDGEIQKVAKLPSQKKVTFVYLEEQDDGSYKVQGVKGNADKEPKTSGAEVDSILKRIKAGEIKLPPPSSQITTPDPVSSPSTIVSVVPLSTPYDERDETPESNVNTRSIYNSSPYSTIVSETEKPFHRVSSTTYQPPVSSSTFRPTTTEPTYQSPDAQRYVETTLGSSPSSTTSKSKEVKDDLPTILKNKGLHAMAKYLKQSGLDAILNETGPYTVFAPTDKAFKSLLVQLGGPERAEEKFRNNPRLLSGLLLHHVIPGSFEISSLQDEMTGVSLAGTQLRVNQYTLHDAEWNDVRITTINGAMIVSERQDIIIPQGIAHGVDRVMFPLPVGDLLQTLQSDRERRFTQFLKAIFASGLNEMLQNKGAKTYTIYAPTDAAFSKLSVAEINNLVNDKEAAQMFVMKHMTPGTLFTAGMRFFQVKDSLLPSAPITIQKSNGNTKVKVNDGQIVTSNIPATNGVIHAVDVLF